MEPEEGAARGGRGGVGTRLAVLAACASGLGRKVTRCTEGDLEYLEVRITVREPVGAEAVRGFHPLA